MPSSILLQKYENNFTGNLLIKMTKVIFDEDKGIKLPDIWFYINNSDGAIHFSIGGLKKLIENASLYIQLLNDRKKTTSEKTIQLYYERFRISKAYLDSEKNYEKWEKDLKRYPDLLILIFCFDELLKRELKLYGTGKVESKRLHRIDSCKDYWKSTKNSNIYVNINAEDKFISFSSNRKSDSYSIYFLIGIVTHSSNYLYTNYLSQKNLEKHNQSITYFREGINDTIKLIVSGSVY